MKIRNIYANIYNGFERRDFAIDFNEPSVDYYKNSNVSIIVGENGVGKTSILRAISEAFFFANRNHRNSEFGCEVEYEINGQHYSLRNFETSPYQEKPKKVIVSSFAVFDNFRINRKSLDIESLNNIETKYAYCGPNIRKGISSLNEPIGKIIKSFYQSKSYLKSESVQYLMDVIGYSGEPYIELNRPRRKIKEHEIDNNEEYYYLQEEVIKLFEEIKINFRNEFKVKSGKYIVPPSFLNPEVVDLLLKINESDYFTKIFNDLLFIKNDRFYRLTEMSSGELTMFLRFFPLINEVCDNSIILIDEPETHLHPKWIKNYVDLLVKLFGDYRVHIIIATHSPLIASDVPKESIIGLKKYGGEVIQYKISKNTLGGETSDILRNVFEIDSYDGNFTIRKKNKIKKLLQESKISEALNLYNDLSLSAEKYKFFNEIKNLLPIDIEDK